MPDQPGFKRSSQSVRPLERAGNAVANTNGQRCRLCIPFPYDVEMVVKARDLIDLGLRQAHLVGQCAQVPSLKTAKCVLDLVQMFNEQVAPARLITQQIPDFVQGRIFQLTPFWLGRLA